MRLTRANDETEYFTKPVLTKFAISRKKCVKLWREESFLPLSDWLAKHELTLYLPWVPKMEFLLAILIQYQADNWRA